MHSRLGLRRCWIFGISATLPKAESQRRLVELPELLAQKTTSAELAQLACCWSQTIRSRCPNLRFLLW